MSGARAARVIFACVHNAGRSQMAAAFFNRLADPARAHAVSAGTQPADRVHPEVVQAMLEVGSDLRASTPRRLTTDLVEGARLLVTMGCEEDCPIVPGVGRDDWPLRDPKGRPPDEVRAIRDEIERRVAALVAARGWSRSADRARHARSRDEPAGTLVIAEASDADWPGVAGLLRACSLPTDGLAEHLATTLVLREGSEVVACAALEVYGDAALLRSVAVSPARRGEALGTRVTRAALDFAERLGISRLYLLTTTASGFFPRFGFQPVPRDEVPAAVRASVEFTTACPASALAMMRGRTSGAAQSQQETT